MAEASPAPTRLHVPSLAAAILLMLAGTAYPPVLTDGQGRADHLVASAVFWAMSAGFVRGVGYVPRQRLWRLLFSGWAVLAGLLLAGLAVAARSGQGAG